MSIDPSERADVTAVPMTQVNLHQLNLARSNFTGRHTPKSPPVMACTFRIFTLPRSHPDPTTWAGLSNKVKAFRLNSLRASPEAFSSTFAIESEFPDDVWLSRLNNPLASHSVALSIGDSSRSLNDVNDELDNIIEGDWLGVGVLIGPKDDGEKGVSASRSPWANIQSPAQVEQGEKTIPLYQLNGLYVMPEARKLGVGKALVDTAFENGRNLERARNGRKALFQVRVESENVAARKLYERAGFSATRQETLLMKEKEKNGMIIPAHEATVLVMERLEDL
jgi:ribosomal protein S18 acetylase RimI-like enzyme